MDKKLEIYVGAISPRTEFNLLSGESVAVLDDYDRTRGSTRQMFKHFNKANRSMKPLETRIQFFADKLHLRIMEIEDQIDLENEKKGKCLMAMSEQVEDLLLSFQETFSDILHLEKNT